MSARHFEALEKWLSLNVGKPLYLGAKPSNCFENQKQVLEDLHLLVSTCSEEEVASFLSTVCTKAKVGLGHGQWKNCDVTLRNWPVASD